MTKKAEPGLGLRATASELGVSRKKLLRMVRDGLPVIRKSERVYVNLEDAKDWIALNETTASRSLLALNPADPRYRLKRATALIDHTNLGLECSVFIRRANAASRYQAEITAFRSALLQVPSMVAEGDGPEAIAAALETALAELKIDDPATWQTPQPERWPKTDISEPAEDAEEYAPMLPQSDPRFATLLLKAERAEQALSDLWKSIIYLDDALAIASAHVGMIRKRIREIPAYVELAHCPGASLIDTLDNEIDSALAELSGEQSHAAPRLAPQVSDEFEDVDGVRSAVVNREMRLH